MKDVVSRALSQQSGADRAIPFRLGEWTVYPDRNLIIQSDRQVSLQPKVMQLLIVLIEFSGQTISRPTLVERVWDDLCVSEAAIDRAVCNLRKALGDQAQNPRYVETIRKKGIRLMVLPVEVTIEPSVRAMPKQELGQIAGLARDQSLWPFERQNLMATILFMVAIIGIGGLASAHRSIQVVTSPAGAWEIEKAVLTEAAVLTDTISDEFPIRNSSSALIKLADCTFKSTQRESLIEI